MDDDVIVRTYFVRTPMQNEIIILHSFVIYITAVASCLSYRLNISLGVCFILFENTIVGCASWTVRSRYRRIVCRPRSINPARFALHARSHNNSDRDIYPRFYMRFVYVHTFAMPVRAANDLNAGRRTCAVRSTIIVWRIRDDECALLLQLMIRRVIPRRSFYFI